MSDVLGSARRIGYNFRRRDSTSNPFSLSTLIPSSSRPCLVSITIPLLKLTLSFTGFCDRSELERHYRLLHSAGVLHTDIETRHWLISPSSSSSPDPDTDTHTTDHESGKIRLIDFDQARTKDEDCFLDKEKVTTTGYWAWKRACQFERQNVIAK